MTWRLCLDARLTRRKRYALAVAPTGEQAFKSQIVGEVVEWLADEGITSYLIVTDHAGEYRATVKLVEDERS